jgi:phospholipid transport system transporter-binding protein
MTDIAAQQVIDAGEPLRLQGTSIRTSLALQSELAARLDESGPVKIDGGAVERIDTAALQLLAAFVREMRAASRTVEWIDSSVALRRAAGSLGLRPVLGLGSVDTNT